MLLTDILFTSMSVNVTRPWFQWLFMNRTQMAVWSWKLFINIYAPSLSDDWIDLNALCERFAWFKFRSKIHKINTIDKLYQRVAQQAWLKYFISLRIWRRRSKREGTTIPVWWLTRLIHDDKMPILYHIDVWYIYFLFYFTHKRFLLCIQESVYP